MYHGSLTTPPCTPTVYWNVINYIFPIKLVEYKRLISMMEARKGQVGSLINNRPIQKVVNQKIQYIGAVFLRNSVAVLTALLSVAAI